METFWFLPLWFPWLYDSAYIFNFPLSLDGKLLYGSDYDYHFNSDSVATENQPYSAYDP